MFYDHYSRGYGIDHRVARFIVFRVSCLGEAYIALILHTMKRGAVEKQRAPTSIVAKCPPGAIHQSIYDLTITIILH